MRSKSFRSRTLSTWQFFFAFLIIIIIIIIIIISFVQVFMEFSRPGSSVDIATDYGLDGPWSNPGGEEIFRPFRPALGPTQSPLKWVTGLSRG